MSEIVMIPIEELLPHPMQEKIYGETEVDAEFVASIRDRGVLQPLLVTDFESEDGRYKVISGHRRLMAADCAELMEVPCQIKSYESEDETVVDLIISNYSREKTNYQRTQEFLQLKQKLCQFGKAKMGHNSLSSLISKNDELWRILQNANFDIEKPFSTIEILKNLTGISEYEQKMNNIIFDDDYCEKKLQDLRNLGLKEVQVKEVYEKWIAVRRLVSEDRVSLNEAVSTIKTMLADIEARFTKKEKKPKQETGNRKQEVEKEDDGGEKTLSDRVTEWLENNGVKSHRANIGWTEIWALFIKFYNDVINGEI